MNIQEGILTLAYFAEQHGINTTIDYRNGKYVPGRLINYDDITAEPDPATIMQGPKGWHVEISGMSYTDDNGEEILYPTINQAIGAGLRLLQESIKARGLSTTGSPTKENEG